MHFSDKEKFVARNESLKAYMMLCAWNKNYDFVLAKLKIGVNAVVLGTFRC